MVPLIIVIAISAIKDIFEDMKRHRSDTKENNREIKRADSVLNRLTRDKWQNLKVGQIVRVSENKYFPADLILIKSSNPNGIVYVETKQLDGETNLKHKESVKELQEVLEDIEKVSTLKGKVVCDTPNDFLYKFDGNLHCQGQQFALNHNQILLRGSSLKNTDWAYGIVVYTGHDTKIMMNSASFRGK